MNRGWSSRVCCHECEYGLLVREIVSMNADESRGHEREPLEHKMNVTMQVAKSGYFLLFFPDKGSNCRNKVAYSFIVCSFSRLHESPSTHLTPPPQNSFFGPVYCSDFVSHPFQFTFRTQIHNSHGRFRSPRANDLTLAAFFPSNP